jgi:hypothetical protein
VTDSLFSGNGRTVRSAGKTNAADDNGVVRPKAGLMLTTALAASVDECPQPILFNGDDRMPNSLPAPARSE